LTSLSELKNLHNLRKLDLNTNKLASLATVPTLPLLNHLDLGNNPLATADCLANLAAYKDLKVIIMAGCPFAEELGDKFKSEVLIQLGTLLKQIKTVNEEEVVDEDITAANDERNERAKAKREAEEEAARLAAEKAAEEAAALAAAAGQKPEEE
jgi:hypothetical protein